jgi:hypothetical protein
MRWSDVNWSNRVIRLPETKNGRQRNLPFWGSIESYLGQHKAYRDKHHPECEHLFFWMDQDTKIVDMEALPGYGGRRGVPGTTIADFRDS